MVAMKLDSAAACSRFLSLSLSSFASISSTRRVVDRTRARLFDPLPTLVALSEGWTKRACVQRAKALAFSREKQGRSFHGRESNGCNGTILPPLPERTNERRDLCPCIRRMNLSLPRIHRELSFFPSPVNSR